jgi:hypothetical protein
MFGLSWTRREAEERASSATEAATEAAPVADGSGLDAIRFARFSPPTDSRVEKYVPGALPVDDILWVGLVSSMEEIFVRSEHCCRSS